MTKLIHVFICAQLAITLIPDALPALELINKQSAINSSSKQILLNNRVLAKVNNKSITVMDVMKKMDLFIFRESNGIQPTLQDRYQYYKVNWLYFLQDLIDEELIMSDAREKKMVVNDATVREELEKAFGPNVRANIATLGLTYQEAWDLLCKDLTVERMLGVSNWKADMAASPALVLSTYYQKSALYQKEGSWTYQVISFRHINGEVAQKYANEAYSLLGSSRQIPDSLQNKIKQDLQQEPLLSINVSKEIKQSTKEIATDLQQILNQLKEGEYSKPVLAASKVKQEYLYRIFYLKERKSQEAINFENVEQEIKSELANMHFIKEKEIYLKRLRSYFFIEDFTKGHGDNFEPFIIY
ncbi:MAG: hypothetical protein K0S74_1638 [Chlamydiales bacterium]|jgi:hypothetical protein|nr:hypothetical protein [Chlamydiales bacterium]